VTTIASSVVSSFSNIDGAGITFGVKFLDEDNNLGLDTNVTVSYSVGDDPGILANLVNDAVSALAVANDWDISAARLVVYAISGLPTFSPDVQAHRVTISSAQLLDLHNTPVEIAPAPSVDSYLVPTCINWTFHAGVTPYAGAVGPTFSCRHQGSSTVLFVIYLDLLGEATDQGNYSTANQAAYFPLSSALGKAIFLSSDAALTAGDGTLEIATQYLLITP
jgi:hypothetical protein